MRRPRGGTAGRLTFSRTWAWLVGGWVVLAILFVALGAIHQPNGNGFDIGVVASAEAAWLTVVLLANAIDELQESISNTPEADRPSHRSPGWRPPWGPLAATALGLVAGWLAWK